MMTMNLTGTTKVLGIIGHPVEHSLSPLMQNAALRELGLDYVYVPFPVEPGSLREAIQGMRALGIRGFNVTIPHKSAIIPFLDKISPEAILCGAVNTVCREEDLLVGYNTDGTGFLTSLGEDLGFQPAGSTVLILGAGGAARGALAALCAAGVSCVVVANRTRERGEAIVEKFRDTFDAVTFHLCSLDMVHLEPFLQTADLLVNTTSVGMNGTSFDGIDLSLMKTGAVVYDMVYSPAETPLLASARSMGIPCANGTGMLAAQGEAAFYLWTCLEPPRGLMKKTLLSEIA